MRSTDNPTLWQARARNDRCSSLHHNAILDTGNWCSTSSLSSLATVSQPASPFVSTTSPQPPGTLPVTRTARPIRGNPCSSSADASRDRVLRDLGSWLSGHEYLNTGQDPIIGRDFSISMEADLLGIKGKTVFTAFFDHTDMETFRCYVCPDVSYDLEVAITHQRTAMHYQD